MLCVLFSLSPALSPSLDLACEGWEWERFKAKQKEGKDVKDGMGAAIWQKPETNDCYSQKEKGSQPPMCEAQDNPDAAW